MPEKLDRCVTSVMADLRKRFPSEAEDKLKSRAFAICNAAMKGGEMEYGYVVQLDESVLTRPVEAVKVGKYKHPQYGDIEITEERLQRFAASVNQKVRGIDADIDYEHKEGAAGGKAAGWVRTAEVKDGTLYLHIDWTDPAKEAITKREYRYFSPELADEWEDAGGGKHKDVFMGGALTNRPFLKNLAPLNFSDYFATVKRDPSNESITFTWSDGTTIVPKDDGREGSVADLKKLAEAVGIKDEDEDKIVDAIKVLKEKSEDDTAAKLAESLGVEPAKLSETVAGLKKYRDDHESDNDKAKKFAEEFPEEAKRLQELAEKDRLADTTMRLSEWRRGGGSGALPPAVADPIRDFRMSLDDPTAKEKFDEIIKGILDKGLVRLDEVGGPLDPTEPSVTASTYADEVDKVFAEKSKEDESFTYEDAAAEVQRAKPELYQAYMRG